MGINQDPSTSSGLTEVMPVRPEQGLGKEQLKIDIKP